MARILIIEDDPDMTLSCRLILENRGYAVKSCRTGEEGLELALTGGTDIIVCDMALPGMDGAEVCRRLKEHPHTRGIPVILFTCVRTKYCIDISERDRAWLPADRIIDKSNTPDALLEAVEELLSGTKKNPPPAA